MKNKKTKIALIVTAAVLLLAIGALLFFLLRGKGGTNGTNGPADVPTVKGPEIVFTPSEFFFEDKVVVTAVCERPATEKYTIYYTYSGASPAADGKKLTERGFTLKPRENETVSCYSVKAIAKFSDGTWSEEAVHSYFVGKDVAKRFDLNVFSLTINPEDYTGEQGIYTNYNETGAEWEKPANVEYFDADGNRLFSQPAGMRIHGGASRAKAMKSYRLYARQEYDSEYKYFDYPIFDGAVDYYGNPITKYKRLVLRSSGNDNNRTFVRDALVQTLAKEAGFQDTEEVRPVALFINGEYQGFYWVQEYISGKYFKATYGDFAGDFEDSDHKENAVDSKEENLEFPDLAELDLTKDANYKKVTDQIDVENYLFYYAINTIVDNEDWPQTNSISYRYVAEPGGEYQQDGPFDGRWRFITHDDDMIFGLGANHPYRECLKAVLDKEAVKHHSKTLDLLPYSPLFAALMERKDCRQMYVQKVKELTDGVFSEKHILETLDKLTKLQANELKYYFSECKYRGEKKLADYKVELQNLKDGIKNAGPSIKQQIFDLWNIDIR